MEREKKIELLKSLKDGTRPKDEVLDLLKVTSQPENCEGKELIIESQFAEDLDKHLASQQ